MDDVDRGVFLDRLARSCEKNEVSILAFALMPNHYHLLLRSGDGHLSEAMRDFSSQYVRVFNRRHGFDGSLGTARFTSVAVETDEQLAEASRYVHRNPLDLGLSHPLDDYRWSSYGHYVGRRAAPEWLAIGYVLSLYGESASRYRLYVETQRPTDETPPAVPLNGSRNPVVHDSPKSVVMSMERVDAAVMRRAGEYQGTARRSPEALARTMGLLLGFEVAGLSCRELGQHYGYATVSATKSALRRGRALAASDHAFAAVLASIRHDLNLWSDTGVA